MIQAYNTGRSATYLDDGMQIRRVMHTRGGNDQDFAHQLPRPSGTFEFTARTRTLPRREPVWTSADGQSFFSYDELEDDHLRNIITYLADKQSYSTMPPFIAEAVRRQLT